MWWQSLVDCLSNVYVYVHMCSHVHVWGGTLGVVFFSLRVYCYFHFLEEEAINERVGD